MTRPGHDISCCCCFCKQDNFQRDMTRFSSIPLPGGGDTHIHIYGKKEDDFVVTTRLPGGIAVHDDLLKGTSKFKLGR